jgi:hypothetical protein
VFGGVGGWFVVGGVVYVVLGGLEVVWWVLWWFVFCLCGVLGWFGGVF